MLDCILFFVIICELSLAIQPQRNVQLSTKAKCSIYLLVFLKAQNLEKITLFLAIEAIDFSQELLQT